MSDKNNKKSPPKVGGNVLINGRTAVHAGSGGVLTTVDVCLTKVGKAVVPIPYTNIARSEDAAQTASTVFINGHPVCHKNSIFAKSSGDEPGNRKGIKSGTITEKAEFVTASSNVYIEGIAAVRQGDYMVSNNANTAPMPLVQPGAPRPQNNRLESVKGLDDAELPNGVALKISGDRLHVQNDLVAIGDGEEDEDFQDETGTSAQTAAGGGHASSATAAAENDPASEPTKPELVIGVFFDGTGNNMLAQPPEQHTNVAKLHDLYFPEETSQIYKQRIYVEGVGTKAVVARRGEVAEKLSLVGLATGLGTYGAGTRLREARDKFIIILNEYRQAYGQPEKVIFDLFGFSRGAMLARHFANVIQAGLPDLQQSPYQGTLPIRPSLRATEIDTPGGDTLADDRRNIMTVSALYPRLAAEVRTRFLGLFDSVGSFFLAGNDDEGFINPYLGSNTAEFVYQLTARDEIRKNFPLTSILPGNGNWVEEEMFGVHSDVGGGYDNTPERIYIEGSSEEYESRDEITDRLHPPEHWKRWCLKMQAKAKDISDRLGIECEVDCNGDIAYFFEIRRTKNDLAKVALKAMYDKALAKGLSLDSIDQGDLIPPTLEHLLQQASADNSTAIKQLDDVYIHRSHRKICLAYISETIGMNAETDGKRDIFPNQPYRAINEEENNS